MQEHLTIWTDEAELLRRAAAPRVEWFPVPRRADAMRPLIWLLALVPILFVVVRSPWTEDAARWGLRCMKLLSADEWSEFVDPGDIAVDGELAFEPPLMTWLTAIAIWSAGSSQPLAVIFPAAVCVFGLVVVSYYLARAVGGPWLGFLTAVLIATHPITQQLVQQPTSSTLGLTLSLTTLWCLFRHLDGPPATWSRWVLLGGVSWGLCLISSGPLAIISLMMVVVFTIVTPKGGLSGRKIVPLNRKSSNLDWRSWKALLIWSATGLLIGAWWPLMMGSMYGPDFWSHWFGLTQAGESGSMLNTDVESWIDGSKVWFRHTAAILPLLTGFIFLGLYRLIRIVFFHEEPQQRRAQIFLLVLAFCVGVMWICSMSGHDWRLFHRPLWTAYLLIPMSMLAAGGFLEVGERHAGFGLTLGAYGLGVLVAVWRYRGLWLDVSSVSHQLVLVLAIALLFGISFWLTLRFIHGYEVRQRWLIHVGIWGLLLAHCAWGVTFLSAGPLQVNSREERPLLQFWNDLRAWRSRQTSLGPDGELYLLTARPSARLHYIVQSVWPRRTLRFATSWEGLTRTQPPTRSRIVVTYGKRDVLRPSAPGDAAAPVPIVPPRIYHQAELTAYEIRFDTVVPVLPLSG